METKVELLLGAKVRDANGENVGRIEEIRVERTDNALLVEAYLIGASAVIDRLSAWTLVRPIKGLLKSGHIYSLYDVPWQDMDLSDPAHPVLRTAKRDLLPAR
jgi:sporulation protein YlmC with PRC-barrel domain